MCVGLLAKAVEQSINSATDTTLSQASPLPHKLTHTHWIYGVWGIAACCLSRPNTKLHNAGKNSSVNTVPTKTPPIST